MLETLRAEVVLPAVTFLPQHDVSPRATSIQIEIVPAVYKGTPSPLPHLLSFITLLLMSELGLTQAELVAA